MAYTAEELTEKVIDVLAEKGSIEREKISLESSLVDDLGMDSLDAVEMVFELEEQYAIKIPDEVIQGFRKVKDIVVYLSKVFQERNP